MSRHGDAEDAEEKKKEALRGFVGLPPDGLDVNVQAKRTKGAKAS